MVLGALGYKIIWSIIGILITIVILLIIKIIVKWRKFLKYLNTSRQSLLVSFKDNFSKIGFPYITFTTLLGKTANFVIDSGSVFSTINNTSLNKFITNKDLPLKHSISFFGIGSKDEGKLNASYKVDLYYKGNPYQGVFYSFDCNDLFTKIEKDTGVKMDGIIGCDFMKKYKYVIDFDNYKIKME